MSELERLEAMCNKAEAQLAARRAAGEPSFFDQLDTDGPLIWNPGEWEPASPASAPQAEAPATAQEKRPQVQAASEAAPDNADDADEDDGDDEKTGVVLIQPGQPLIPPAEK